MIRGSSDRQTLIVPFRLVKGQRNHLFPASRWRSEGKQQECSTGQSARENHREYHPAPLQYNWPGANGQEETYIQAEEIVAHRDEVGLQMISPDR